ncbi:alpha/beta hydrolase fold domain-containing protein [Rhodococcoides yunnanense]|uniref:alpha/beta hydrolase fold domain-containing protein n=1 Tax=Rhodococcoides yunnanense TaxID=278209 RepID=UPI000934362B|nr:alpha/beta hydrolase [Rhodococcus yunnanensis]
MPSLASALMPLVVRVRGSKRRYSSAERTQAHVDKMSAEPASYAPPTSLGRKVSIVRDDHDEWPVFRVSPRGPVTDRTVVYFHGGAYLWEITSTHWRTIAGLVARTGVTFLVPIYPLAPSATAESTVAVATDIAAAAMVRYGSNDVVLMGDSAGGGLALVVAQQLRDTGHGKNRHTILISPWLDVSMTDPEIERIAPTDPWLGIPGTKLAGILYRGSLPEDDPRVSPLRGEIRNLAPVTMFSGTRDIANADARALVRLAAAAGTTIDYHEERGMLHVYPLLPIPEGRRARRHIADIITRR